MSSPRAFAFSAIAVTLGLGFILVRSGWEPARVWVFLLLLHLGYHGFQLLRLVRLIRARRWLVAPWPPGLWGEVYRAIGRYQQQGRKGRKRHVRFRRRFRDAAEAVPDAVVILDKHQRVQWANPVAVPLLNVHWPQDRGRRLTERLNRQELATAIEVADYRRPLDLTPEHDRGLVLGVRVAPFGERKRQRLVVARDVTEIHHLNMIRRDFVANTSHELRTPLTVITGFLENLAEAPATPVAHQRPLTLMQQQARRMRAILDDLLTLSRLEMDHPESNHEPVDLAAEINTIIHEAEILSGDQHRFAVALDRGLLLRGNRLELRSAVSNLIHNAVRHTPPGSLIQIRWVRDEDGPLFSVEDNGDGIAAEHLPRLTERFYRVDPSRSRASGGTGLGLAIVKHVLNRHGARLVIDSTVGVGTRFLCHFPPGRPRAPRRRPAAGLPPPVPGP